MSGPPPTKYRYHRRLPHLQRDDSDLFVTFRLNGPFVLPEMARDLVLEHILREGGVARAPSPAGLIPRIRLHAAVVMPNHVHLIFSPRRDQDGGPYPVVEVLQCLKGATAHRINKLLGTAGPVWQEESFDHVLRFDESLAEKCEYVRQNPVRAGLVERPEDYRWLWTETRVGV
jgi:REP element-mobilizing transposase RayT